MRPKSLLIFPLAALALAGCLNEDTGDCDISNNLELVFTYTDNPDRNFTEIITSVDVYLFDEEECFHEHRRVELGNKASFTVPAGTYHAVAWGNARGNTTFTPCTQGITVFDDGFVQISPEATESGDPLYYAPYRAKPAARGHDTRSKPTTRSGDMSLYAIDVPAGRRTVKILDFVRAHRTVNVWIRGYSEMMAGQSVYPIVTTTNRWCRYDPFFQTQSDRSNYVQQSLIVTLASVQYAAATFHTALGQIDNAVEVKLNSPADNRHILTVNLLNFITVNNITDTDEIDILITFPASGDDYGVTVTVPSWGETPVSPGT